MSKSPFYKTGISNSPLFEAGEYADVKRKQAVRKGQKRLTGKAAEEAIGLLQMNESSPLYDTTHGKKGHAHPHTLKEYRAKRKGLSLIHI